MIMRSGFNSTRGLPTSVLIDVWILPDTVLMKTFRQLIYWCVDFCKGAILNLFVGIYDCFITLFWFIFSLLKIRNGSIWIHLSVTSVRLYIVYVTGLCHPGVLCQNIVFGSWHLCLLFIPPVGIWTPMLVSLWAHLSAFHHVVSLENDVWISPLVVFPCGLSSGTYVPSQIASLSTWTF